MEAWGDLPKFRAHLEGKEEVTEAEWAEARTMKVDTTKGEQLSFSSYLLVREREEENEDESRPSISILLRRRARLASFPPFLLSSYRSC